jgi:hypothetical protein
MLETGVWAEVIVGGEHLKLYSEDSGQGVHVSVYNVHAKKWIAPSETANDIEEGKDKAAAYAKAYLKHAANADLPPLTWKKARSK